MEQQALLQAIIDSSEDAIVSKDLHGFITSWNKGAENIFEYTQAEAIGKNITMLIPTNKLDEETMILSNIRAGKKIEHFETTRLTKSGREVYISLTVSPIKDAAGRITGASKIARDITRQVQAQQQLQHYTERLQIINRLSRQIAAELDVQQILQKVTDAATDISGAAFGAFFYNRIDTQGETYTLYALSGAPREAFEKFGMPRNTDVFKITFEGEGILRSDNITKDPRYGKNAPHRGMPAGHLPVISYLAVPVISKSGVVLGGLFFGHSREGVFKAEHESLVAALASQAAVSLDNARLYEEIKILNAQKDTFIGFASHELKTPLTTANGYVQLGLQAPETAANLLPKIGRQLARLSAIIADLLDISRIQAGKLDMHFEPISLVELVRSSLESMEQVTAAHQLECLLPTQDITVLVDAKKMEQVFINLVINAVKYSAPATKITINTTLLGDEVQVSVHDQGIGIPEKHVHKIFDRFYRIVGPGNNADGLGLGLYISRSILEAHGGKIWAESTEGAGSVFYCSFPVHRSTP